MADRPLIARRRAKCKPSRVVVLLVGESAPAGGTHYYLANSNLYRGIREAFGKVYGPALPDGEEFLSFVQAQGCWLVDLASEPVDQLPGRIRRAAVSTGVVRIASVVRKVSPVELVAVKKSIERDVRLAVDRAQIQTRLTVLPFPAMGWQSDFVSGLATVLRRARRGQVAMSSLGR